VRIFDRNVKLAGLMGSNKSYLLNHIPHIFNLVVDSIDAVMDHAQTVVIGNDDPTHGQVFDKLKNGQVIVDFARIGNRMSDGGNITASAGKDHDPHRHNASRPHHRPELAGSSIGGFGSSDQPDQGRL